MAQFEFVTTRGKCTWWSLLPSWWLSRRVVPGFCISNNTDKPTRYPWFWLWSNRRSLAAVWCTLISCILLIILWFVEQIILVLSIYNRTDAYHDNAKYIHLWKFSALVIVFKPQWSFEKYYRQCNSGCQQDQAISNFLQVVLFCV